MPSRVTLRPGPSMARYWDSDGPQRVSGRVGRRGDIVGGGCRRGRARGTGAHVSGLERCRSRVARRRGAPLGAAVVASRATKLGDVPSDSRGPLPEPPTPSPGSVRCRQAVRDTGLRRRHDRIPGVLDRTGHAAPVVLGSTSDDGDRHAPSRRRVGTRAPHALCARRRHRRHRRVPHRFPAAVVHPCVPRRRSIVAGSRPITAIAAGPCPSAPSARSRFAGREHRHVDCVVTGLASDIYLALWNRAPLESLRIEGDGGVTTLVREKVHIRWG